MCIPLSDAVQGRSSQREAIKIRSNSPCFHMYVQLPVLKHTQFVVLTVLEPLSSYASTMYFTHC